MEKWKAAGQTIMYEARAALNPSLFPMMILVNLLECSQSNQCMRLKQYLQLQQRNKQRGQASPFYLHPNQLEEIKQSIPDTFGKSQQRDCRNATICTVISNAKANVEKGDPGCDANKFSYLDGDCGSRKGMTSWHPGWYVA